MLRTQLRGRSKCPFCTFNKDKVDPQSCPLCFMCFFGNLSNLMFFEGSDQPQLVEHRVVTREVVSSTPAGPTLRALKYLRNKCYLCNYINKWLDFKSSRIRTINRRPRLTVPSMFKMSTSNVKEPIPKEQGVKFPVLWLSFPLANVAGLAVMFQKGLLCKRNFAR